MNDLKFIPNDHSHQTSPEKFVETIISNTAGIKLVLDLGCGDGRSADLFIRLNEKITWLGLDLPVSPEVALRTRTDLKFIDFNGIDIPFKGDSFDLIYCRQVLEHVKNPRELLTDVFRVLKPGGYFIGSTSHLEPYHSLSYWNFTPYGFNSLIEEAGLEMIELRPSIDALTLIIRRGLGSPSFFSRWWDKESPLNKFISFIGMITRKRPNLINQIKLLFCGQFSFLIRKSNRSK